MSWSSARCACRGDGSDWSIQESATPAVVIGERGLTLPDEDAWVPLTETKAVGGRATRAERAAGNHVQDIARTRHPDVVTIERDVLIENTARKVRLARIDG